MNLRAKLDHLHFRARQNVWLAYFSIFCRIVLALGFLPSGMQKVLGERFTVLPAHHPMGHFLDAFFQTGYYYTFVGLAQVLAAILLLIPRTVTIGALLYLPIILNICILSFAVRFDGSLITSPLMLCAVLYLLCWDYHKIKLVFPFNHAIAKAQLPTEAPTSREFPYRFFAGVVGVIVAVVLHASVFYDILPRNTSRDCQAQCVGQQEQACLRFCACIHQEGRLLKKCLEEYDQYQ